MEISRLRAELARVKVERDILGKATHDLPISPNLLDRQFNVPRQGSAGPLWSLETLPQSLAKL